MSCLIKIRELIENIKTLELKYDVNNQTLMYIMSRNVLSDIDMFLYNYTNITNPTFKIMINSTLDDEFLYIREISSDLSRFEPNHFYFIKIIYNNKEIKEIVYIITQYENMYLYDENLRKINSLNQLNYLFQDVYKIYGSSRNVQFTSKSDYVEAFERLELFLTLREIEECDKLVVLLNIFINNLQIQSYKYTKQINREKYNFISHMIYNNKLKPISIYYMQQDTQNNNYVYFNISKEDMFYRSKYKQSPLTLEYIDKVPDVQKGRFVPYMDDKYLVFKHIEQESNIISINWWEKLKYLEFTSLFGPEGGLDEIRSKVLSKNDSYDMNWRSEKNIICLIKYHFSDISKAFYQSNNDIINKYLPVDVQISMLKSCNLKNKVIHYNILMCQYIIRFISELLDKDVEQLNILDSSSGWFDRATSCAMLNVRKYKGFDPNIKLSQYYENIIEFLSFHSDTVIDIEYIPFEDSILVEQYDVVITSPPFFDLEVYDIDGSQSISQHDSCGSWIKGWYIPVVDKLLNHAKYVVLSVDNFKDCRIHDETLEYCTQRNLRFFTITERFDYDIHFGRVSNHIVIENI